ncbi:hypothetical protein [Allosphingosinicella deserti]|nr:hypothetical protein [Sphingomonas deserti]
MLKLAVSTSIAVSSHLAGATSVQTSPPIQEKHVLTVEDLNKLSFLIGRWSGNAPDGRTFYEEYSRPEPTLMRSQRYKDASFSEAVNGSTVALKDGKLISTWGEFTWVATSVEDGRVSFSPMNAPSSFSWRRVDTDTVEVTQNWTDEKGAAQSYALELKRVQ